MSTLTTPPRFSHPKFFGFVLVCTFLLLGVLILIGLLLPTIALDEKAILREQLLWVLLSLIFYAGLLWFLTHLKKKSHPELATMPFLKRTWVSLTLIMKDHILLTSAVILTSMSGTLAILGITVLQSLVTFVPRGWETNLVFVLPPSVLYMAFVSVLNQEILQAFHTSSERTGSYRRQWVPMHFAEILANEPRILSQIRRQDPESHSHQLASQLRPPSEELDSQVREVLKAYYREPAILLKLANAYKLNYVADSKGFQQSTLSPRRVDPPLFPDMDQIERDFLTLYFDPLALKHYCYVLYRRKLKDEEREKIAELIKHYGIETAFSEEEELKFQREREVQAERYKIEDKFNIRQYREELERKSKREKDESNWETSVSKHADINRIIDEHARKVVDLRNNSRLSGNNRKEAERALEQSLYKLLDEFQKSLER